MENLTYTIKLRRFQIILTKEFSQCLLQCLPKNTDQRRVLFALTFVYFFFIKKGYTNTDSRRALIFLQKHQFSGLQHSSITSAAIGKNGCWPGSTAALGCQRVRCAWTAFDADRWRLRRLRRSVLHFLFSGKKMVQILR